MGKKPLKESAEISPDPVYLRTHNLLTRGDGTASLGWGSTKVYTDPGGLPLPLQAVTL